MEHDPFPYKLDPPIDRPGDDHLEVEDILKKNKIMELSKQQITDLRDELQAVLDKYEQDAEIPSTTGATPIPDIPPSGSNSMV